MKSRRHHHIFIFLMLCLGAQPLWAQTGYNLVIKKPKPYENRELKSEKTGDKKFNAPRRFFQNTFTHYNYFFNAHNKLNEVVNRAKAVNKDDYSKLLPFYNYSLEATAQDKSELDSIIYKSKTGIVLHDLRNDWIDDLYFLWGQAYYLQRQYDSAYQMFQFINYSFADKEKDGYYRYIGSRMDGAQTTTISSNEKVKFPKGIISDPPIRNSALIWEVRSLIALNAMVEAQSLMITLQNDPLFPARLQDDLEEVKAFWFYQQNRWDSAALHLTKALGNASNLNEKARWEYLAAQLFEKSNNTDQAIAYYNKSITHTTDPVMDIYARLNLIRINKTGGDNYIDQNVAELVKMAKRDKYLDYRDVIYYMAGQMELERKNYAAAQQFFLKAAKYKGNNLPSSNQGFLLLADMYYNQKDYTQAAFYYDSVRIENMPTDIAQRTSTRKEMLSRLVAQIKAVQLQDSLQHIAGLPQAERDDYLKKLVRQLRRQQGLKEEAAAGTSNVAALQGGADAFGNTKGEWYFYNDKLRTQGAAAFKQLWRDRPNVDNWRRYANAVAQLRNTLPENTRGNPVPGDIVATAELTYEGLLATLPLTPEKIQLSNEAVANALYTSGKMYVNELEDYDAAIKVYEDLRSRFPNYTKKDEVLFNLYYSYTKTGNKVKAEEIKKLLTAQNMTDRYATIVATGKDPNANTPAPEVTKTYEGIYDLFLEGKFNEALAAKQHADSVYHTNYWSPQLLYIEAVYHTKQREDSVAKNVLNTLIQQNSGTPMAAKATNLLNVLNRRQQIEAELTALNIERPVEEKVVAEPEPVIVTKTQQVKTDTIAAKKTEVAIAKPVTKPVADTTTAKPVSKAPTFTYKPDATHYAVVILNKVDVVYGNEAKNAFARYNREKYYNRTIDINLQPIDEDNKLLIIGEFTIQSAIDYVQKARPIAANEIVPWLKKDKYSFTIISANNLEVLQQNHDIELYKKFLDQNLPVKF